MSTMRPVSAKIMQHSQGMGVPSVHTVRRRAFELARIDGRAGFTEQDWAHARQELHGGHEPNDTNGEMDMTCMVSEHDMVSGSIGRHVENMGLDDVNTVGEELFAEGMDEAIHEQMLASREKSEAEDADMLLGLRLRHG